MEKGARTRWREKKGNAIWKEEMKKSISQGDGERNRENERGEERGRKGGQGTRNDIQGGG